MKLRIIAFASVVLAASVHAEGVRTATSAAQVNTTASTQSLDELITMTSPGRSGLSGIRSQVLREAGRTMGFRGGLKQCGRQLALGLEGRSAVLDQIFQFATLVTADGVLPPVIEEASDVASFDVDQFRTADHVYRIARPERFISVPPTWRDYLLAGLAINGPLDMPDTDILPKDEQEAALWRGAITSGWGEGCKQGEAIMTANFNRLTRDFTGMLRYSTLIQQGQIRRTRVAESVQIVTGDGQRLAIGDRHRRITEKATLEPDPRNWTPTTLMEKPKPRGRVVSNGNVVRGPQK
ncbi:MAG: type IV secretion system DotC family protein [Burkholderiaceae bacterium]|nr:type IV secretion system DotC family protein [Burkholderiaceae bacterium]